jgi:hypothetical protein
VATVRVVISNDHRTQVKGAIGAAVEAALRGVGDNCLEEANRSIPIEEGILQDTGFVEVTRTATGSEGQVGYNTPYAVIQHEDPSLRHDPGREDHWLERTVDRNRDRYAAYVAEKVGGSFD